MKLYDNECRLPQFRLRVKQQSCLSGHLRAPTATVWQPARRPMPEIPNDPAGHCRQYRASFSEANREVDR